MSDLLADIPVTRLLPQGRHGRASGVPGLVVRTLDTLGMATLAARRGAEPQLAEAASAAFGVLLPLTARLVAGGDLAFIATAPGRWSVVSETLAGDALVDRLAGALGAHAAVTDQSDANLVFELSGPQVREAMEKLVALDLHPGVFGVGDAAATSVALMPVLFWQAGEAPSYRFAVPRSFAPSFLRAVAAAGAPIGMQVMGELVSRPRG